MNRKWHWAVLCNRMPHHWLTSVTLTTRTNRFDLPFISMGLNKLQVMKGKHPTFHPTSITTHAWFVHVVTSPEYCVFILLRKYLVANVLKLQYLLLMLEYNPTDRLNTDTFSSPRVHLDLFCCSCQQYRQVFYNIHSRRTDLWRLCCCSPARRFI